MPEQAGASWGKLHHAAIVFLPVTFVFSSLFM